MRNVLTVFRRELKAYFDSPVAYVFLTAFLVLIGFLTFAVAMFYERRQADLTPFFFWHPWVYLLLVPAATMGLWADERRNGTAEMLLTLPITTTEALIGKFLAAWSFLGIALVLTCPVVFTTAYLGDPDWGAIACGYLGSFLMAGAACAVGLFASTLSRSSVVGFVIALAMTFLLMIIGFDPVCGAVAGWGVPVCIVDTLASLSLLSHFESMMRAVVDAADIGYYVFMIVFFLAAAKTVTDGRRGASKGFLALGLIAVVAIVVDVLLGMLPLRVDLTAERLYTLSKGSRAVLAELERPVTLKYYFSSSDPQVPMALKTYAHQVENLLDEYSRAGGSNIVLEKYDPKPDSDAEESAQRYGVEPQRTTTLGTPIYFGLVAVCEEHESTLGTLSPRTEATLEYDITRLVTRVEWPGKPVIGVMTSTTEGGGALEWASIRELSKDYDVRTVSLETNAVDAAISTLILVQVKNLATKTNTLEAIEDFVKRGGRLIACVDPLPLKELIGDKAPKNGFTIPESTDLGPLLGQWGVTFDANRVTTDLKAATKINLGTGTVDNNPAFLTLGKANADSGDVAFRNMNAMMFPFAGSFEFHAPTNGLHVTFQPLLTTSTEHSGACDRFSVLMGNANRTEGDGTARVVVARLSGDVNALLFADSDFLADDFCVRLIRTPFGNMIQPLNDNIALFSNVIEQYAGRSELIGVRTRGRSDRPFAVVNELETEATAKWQKKEAALQKKLQEAQTRINELQRSKKDDSSKLVLTQEQQDEIVKFRKAQADTRRELKNVRKELTADVEHLGMKVKTVNIALVAVLVALFGIVRFIRRK